MKNATEIFVTDRQTDTQGNEGIIIGLQFVKLNLKFLLWMILFENNFVPVFQLSEVESPVKSGKLPRQAFVVDELVGSCWKFVSKIEISFGFKSPVESSSVMSRAGFFLKRMAHIE